MKAELGCGTEASEAETAANGKGQLMRRAPVGKHTARKPPAATLNNGRRRHENAIAFDLVCCVVSSTQQRIQLLYV